MSEQEVVERYKYLSRQELGMIIAILSDNIRKTEKDLSSDKLKLSTLQKMREEKL